MACVQCLKADIPQCVHIVFQFHDKHVFKAYFKVLSIYVP